MSSTCDHCIGQVYCMELILATLLYVLLQVYCMILEILYVLLQVYCMMMVVLQYVAPLSIITFAYIRMGVKLWGTKTPGQVMTIISY